MSNLTFDEGINRVNVRTAGIIRREGACVGGARRR